MGYKILIVDDDPDVRKVLESMLLRESYDVFCASSGKEALIILAQQEMDVIISDEQMPGIAGTEFLATVRIKYPDTIRIVLTGHATLESAIKAMNEGEIYRFFTKPCNMIDLKVTIRQGINHNNLIKENRRLLKLVKEQSLSLETLEKQCPGITEVKRDINGAIIINDD